jgi:EAL and modified HD-GYP domain-containing signal transduction protein
LVANISSVQHALAILGVEPFKKWFSLALMQKLSTDKPSEVLKISLARARFMEGIGEHSSLRRYTEELMLIGLLSVIDGMLEQPMEEILKTLPLAQVIKDTLNHKETPLLNAYKMALDYERGLFAPAAEYCAAIQFDCDQMAKMYYEAIRWSEELFGLMQS